MWHHQRCNYIPPGKGTSIQEPLSTQEEWPETRKLLMVLPSQKGGRGKSPSPVEARQTLGMARDGHGADGQALGTWQEDRWAFGTDSAASPPAWTPSGCAGYSCMVGMLFLRRLLATSLQKLENPD